MKTTKTHIIFFILITLLVSMNVFSLTNYTVNHLGGGNYTDLTACITAINGGADTDYVVTFTDAGAYTYVLSPGEQNIRNGVNLTFTHSTAGIVAIDGRLNVANAGGSFTASNIRFQNTFSSSGSDWCILHGYGFMSFTNCILGPAPIDNGVIIWGDSLFESCTFNGVLNSAIQAGALPGTPNGGTGAANNCTWTNCGRAVATWANVAAPKTGKFVVNGGSATGTNTKQAAILLMGFNLEVNNFTSTGFISGVTTDWQEGGGTLVCNNSNFLGTYDRAFRAYPDASGRLSTYTIDCTFNNCKFEVRSDASGVDCAVIDGRALSQNITATFNSCVLSCPSLSGSCAIAWQGGTINLNNTVLNGANNSMICNSNSVAYQTNLNVNHCVFANSATQVLGVGNYTETSVKVQNSIVDVSNGGGMNATGSNLTTVIEYNLVNKTGTTNGSPYFTGDPLFVNGPEDPGTDNFHISSGSPCENAGISTALIVDVDGQARPWSGSNPDIGIDEIGSGPPPSPPVTISGTVQTSGGDAVVGVLISVDSGPYSDTTDASSSYSFQVPYNWSGRATPSKVGYAFSPPYRDYSNITSNQSNQIYTTTTPTPKNISGYVKTSTNDGILGVLVSANNGGGSDTSDSSGYYSFSVPYNWSGTATPALTGYSFTPTFRNHSNVVTDLSDQNYTGEPISSSTITIYMIQEGYTHLGAGYSKYWSATTDLISSLAGLLAQLDTGQYIYLYIPQGGNPACYKWATSLPTYYNVVLDWTYDNSNPNLGYWALINHLKSLLPNQQYIKFSYNDTDARTAMSIAGLEQCLAVEETIAADVQTNCGFSEKESLVGQTEAQNWSRFSSNPLANKDLMCENTTTTNYGTATDYKYYLNDLAVAERTWIFWDPDRGAPRSTYINWLNDNARHIGVSAGDEGDRIADMSIRGVRTIPGDWAWNLATLSRFENETPKISVRAHPLTMRDIVWEDNVNYCTFLMTDGDNLIVWEGNDWTYGSNYWGSPLRGSFAMGWQLPPSMSKFTPIILANLLDPLSTLGIKDNECFVTGVCGDGVFFVGPPSDTTHTFGTATAAGSGLITTHAIQLNEWMKKYAINIITAFPWSRTEWLAYNFQNYSSPLERPLGFLVDTYAGSYVEGYGELKWPQDKDGYYIPSKSADYALWDSPYGRNASQIASLVNAAPHTGAPVQASFIHIATHAWSWISDGGIMSKVNEAISSMNSYVHVVRSDEFLMQMRLRLRTTQELQHYYDHLSAKTTELDGLTPPTTEADDALTQAELSLSLALPLISSNSEQAFNYLKQGDEETEVARLSFLTLTKSDDKILIDCPTEASPLYHYALPEIDSNALPVRQYQVQADDNSDFLSPIEDILMANTEYTPPIDNCYVRARAQGDSHGDWGYWSQTFHSSTGVDMWYIY